MSKHRTRKTNKGGEFVRKTVTIPAELIPFSEEQSERPEHAGNFSSYVRQLILGDRQREQKVAA